MSIDKMLANNERYHLKACDEILNHVLFWCLADILGLQVYSV